MQIVKDENIASVVNELKENKNLISGGKGNDMSGNALLRQYVKLMYNIRIGLVLLLLKKDESLSLNDVRYQPLCSIIAQVRQFVFVSDTSIKTRVSKRLEQKKPSANTNNDLASSAAFRENGNSPAPKTHTAEALDDDKQKKSVVKSDTKDTTEE